jgi:6-phosphogluconolactonase
MTSPLYIAVNTNESQNGLLHATFDSQTGTMTTPKTALPTPSIMFLALSPNKRNLYGVSADMLDNGQKVGGVLAFEIDPESGALTALKSEPRGGVLCHLSVDATGKWLLTAAYTDGQVAAWELAEDGSINGLATLIQHEGRSEGEGADERRQSAPHAHHIMPSLDNKQVFAADLGLDKIVIYDFDDTTGALTPANPAFAQTAPGAGPRHAVFHPNGQFLYSVNELDNTVTVFAKQDGAWNALQAISTLPEGTTEGTWTAEIIITADGRFVYATNRGHHSIAAYLVGGDGQLSLIGIVPSGRFPQHITFDPTEKWLLSANTHDNSISIFQRDTGTGELLATGTVDGLPGGTMCLQFG